ncbi:MAG TPA: SDR family oxidoreductase [Usitatibacter sp.]|nr:SDR family oxidoreductase [Usitatibacter sp.]
MAKRGIVVVSGASAGIGRATARRFAKDGWRVAVFARGVDGLEGAVRDIEAAGGEAMAIPLDVADESALEAAADRVEREWGPIDVWINNAMVTAYCEFMDMSPQDFRRATEVTYFGSVWGIRAALKRMLPRDRGTIVQVGSALAYRSIPLQSAYCGAKSALRGFIDSLRSELIHNKSGVHLTMVQLSAFNTPQFDWGKTCIPKQPQPVPPIFQPEVAAEGIHYAATHRRRELWVGWPAVKAILATRMIPGILDRILARQGYSGQHTDEPLPPGRKDNLYEPVPGDHGAHGRFDARSKPASIQLVLDMNRTLIFAGAALLAGLGGGVALARRLK